MLNFDDYLKRGLNALSIAFTQANTETGINWNDFVKGCYVVYVDNYKKTHITKGQKLSEITGYGIASIDEDSVVDTATKDYITFNTVITLKNGAKSAAVVKVKAKDLLNG